MSSLPNLLNNPKEALIALFLWIFGLVVMAVVNKVVNKTNGFKEIFSYKFPVHAWVVVTVFTIFIFMILNYVSDVSVSKPVLSNTTESTIESTVPANLWLRLNDYKTKWDIVSEMKLNSDGYYCPRGTKDDFKYRSLWFKDGISSSFEKIGIRFTVKKDKKDSSPLRTVLSLIKKYDSEKFEVFKFYIPFDGSEGVNIEAFDPKEKGLVWRSNAGELILPIQNDTPVTINIGTTTVDNTINYEYVVEYIPEGEISSIKNTFQYPIIFLDPSPRNLLVNFGIGIFHGGCLSDIEYVIN